MTREYSHYDRQFLNEPGHHTTAFLLAAIGKRRSFPGEGAPEVEFVLGDCHRVISLDFQLWGKPADRARSLRKLDRIIKSLTRFRVALGKAAAVEDRLEKQRDATRRRSSRKKSAAGKG
jgi:hypothetical protein